MITITKDWPSKCPVGDLVVPETSTVVDGGWPWLKWLRSNISDRIFVYFHHFTLNWVVAAWVYAPGEKEVPVCKQLATFRTKPNQEWPQDLSPPSVFGMYKIPFEDQYAQMLQSDREREYNKREERRRDREERAAMEKYLRSKVENYNPVTLVDWIPRSEHTDSLAKLIKDPRS